jgi:hypothetical protein
MNHDGSSAALLKTAQSQKPDVSNTSPTKNHNEDEENKETEDSDAIDDKEEDEKDEEEGRKKRKLEKHMKTPSTSFAAKYYLGEFSFKASPNKMGKPNSKSSPFKPVAEVTKKKTMGKKFGKFR